MASSTKSSRISWRLPNNFLFYRVGLLAPRPTPIPEDQVSVFISPRGRVATHFSRLLQHAWVTVGLFLFPGHHTGIFRHLLDEIDAHYGYLIIHTEVRWLRRGKMLFRFQELLPASMGFLQDRWFTSTIKRFLVVTRSCFLHRSYR
jgi:hypothetical protein